MATVKKRTQKKKIKVGIVVSQFNDFISKSLLDGCLNELSKKGVRKSDIRVIWVPGAFEIPVVALKMAKKRNIDAVICLGAVIRGGTYHFEMVSQGCTYGITQVALETGKPVIFGVLTTDTIEQAYKRCGKKGDNKGVEAAEAAISMVKVLSKI